MRLHFHFALAATAAVGLAMPLAIGSSGSAAAQGKEAAAPEEAAPKQIALTQTMIDNLIAAQKAIQPMEAKASQGKAGEPDAKQEASIEAAIKKNGFTDVKEYADVSFSVGLVLAGMDPETGAYIGTQAAIKKQMSEVQADKKMPPKEKKEAMSELSDALKSAPADKPLTSNIDLVKKNVDKLNQGMQQAE